MLNGGKLSLEHFYVAYEEPGGNFQYNLVPSYLESTGLQPEYQRVMHITGKTNCVSIEATTVGQQENVYVCTCIQVLLSSAGMINSRSTHTNGFWMR